MDDDASRSTPLRHHLRVRPERIDPAGATATASRAQRDGWLGGVTVLEPVFCSIATHTPDPFGARTGLADNLASAGVTTLSYDAAHRLANVAASYGGTAGPRVAYGYDNADRLTSQSRTVGGVGTAVATGFGYDNADRLTTLTHQVAGGSALAAYAYGYDDANRQTSEQNAEGTVTYGYDNANELTGASGSRAEAYAYDANGNRTMTGYATGAGNRMTSGAGYTYAYDAEGNLTSKTQTAGGTAVTTYSYDYRNRLTGVTVRASAGGAVTSQSTYTYDAQDRRIGVNANGTPTWTAYDGQNPYADFNGAGVMQTRYLYGPAVDALLARTSAVGTTAWYLTDKLGTVRDITNTSGSVIDHLAYYGYGKVLTESQPANGDRFKFTGREYDVAAGLYFYRARYYDAASGRFVREDPRGFDAGDADLYRYVGNGPTNGSDPSGLQYTYSGGSGGANTPNNPGNVMSYLFGPDPGELPTFLVSPFGPSLQPSNITNPFFNPFGTTSSPPSPGPIFPPFGPVPYPPLTMPSVTEPPEENGPFKIELEFCKQSGETQLGHDMTDRLVLPCDLLDRPGQGRPQRFSDHRPTGLADGHQPMERPFLRTALLQLAHEQTVRQHDQVHVPGLALVVTQLTITQSELLLAVPMERLRARPTLPVHSHDSTHLPGDPIGHQDLATRLILTVMPQHDDPYLVLHLGDLHRHGEVPLAFVADPHLLAVRRRDRRRQLAGLDDPAFPLQLAVELEVAHVASGSPRLILLVVDVVEDLGVGEVAVEGEVAGDLPLVDPVDQLAAELGMVAERLLDRLADLLFAKEAEFQGVVLAGGADVVDEEVVLGDLVPLLGVVPVPPGIGDQHPVPVDEGVVDGDDALVAVAGGRIFLERLQPPIVEGLGVPPGVGEVAIEAGLIGGPCELVVDAQDGLPLGDEEPGEVFGEVATLAFVGEEVAVLSQGILDQLGEFDDPRHDRMLRSPKAPERFGVETSRFCLFYHPRRTVCKTPDRIWNAQP